MAAALGLSICAASPGYAQDTVKTSRWTLQEAIGNPENLEVSGSVRLRYESIDGQARTGFNSSTDLFSVRTRLAAEYDAGAFRIGGELYDSRAFGAKAGDPVSNNEVNTLEFVQAYVAADLGALPGEGGKASAQLGRFTLNLGSRRIVAADDFRNTTNGYTGARLDGHWKNGASVTVFYVLPQSRRPDDVNSIDNNETQLDHEGLDQKLYGGLVTAPAGPGGSFLEASYYGFEERDRSDAATRDRNLHTYGLRWFREASPGEFHLDVEGMAQTGNTSASSAANAARLEVSASYMRAAIGYQWPGDWKPRVTIEYDHASGDKPGGDYQRFDTLFGSRSSEIAPSGINAAIGRANFDARGIRLELKPTPQLDLMASIKSLHAASRFDAFSTTGVRDASGASGDFGGAMLHTRARYWIIPEGLRFDANLFVLGKGRLLKDAPNANAPDDTFYLALDVTAFF